MAAPPNLVLQVGSYLALAHIFILYARIPEFMSWTVGSSLHIVAVVMSLAMFAAVTTGGMERLFRAPICVLVLAFTGWLILSVPFSVWRGGSVSCLKTYWSVSLLTCLLIASLILTLDQCRQAMYAVAAATFFIILLSSYRGSTVAQWDKGRFSLEEGSFRNPNELANILLMGLPFCLLLAMNRRMSFGKIAGALGCAVIPLTIVRTGSRAGLLTLLLLVLVFFFHVSFINKFRMIFGIACLLVMGVSLTKPAARDRYKTLLSGSDKDSVTKAEASALESEESRMRLLVASVYVTFQHPLLGAGPGMFPVVMGGQKDLKGFRMGWRQTHNTYTQISSEGGLPALIIYCALLIVCLKMTRSIQKSARAYTELRPIQNMAFCLFLSLLSHTFAALFFSQAYWFPFPMLAGITASFYRAARAEIQSFQTQSGNSSAGGVRSPAPVLSALRTSCEF